MSNFDVNAYFANKVGNTTTQEKLDALAAASREKVAGLEAIRQAGQEELARRRQEKVDYENSWVGKLGLEPQGFIANRVNDVASLVSGASRLGGQVAALPVSIKSIADQASVTQEETDAYNRYVAGKPQGGDISILNTPKGTNGITALEQIQQANATRDAARKVTDTFDLTKIVDQTNRRELSKDLGHDFDAAWGKVTQGWSEGQKGEFLSASGNMAKGLGSLLLNAGTSILTNPSAVREYVLENAPQLMVGMAGKAGQAAMAASNIGYAVDNYQQGIENYMKAHGGQMPSDEQRGKMAMLAATLALAEEAGDVVGLGFAKGGSKAAGAAVDAATDQATRSGFRNTLKAAGGGAASETPTEGYQTWAEGEVTGKPASAKDVYTGAVIGGASGGGLSGGIHGAAEITGATPEKQAARASAAEKAAIFDQAAATGDISKLMDPSTSAYAPHKAIDALFAHSKSPEATDESKKASLEKAGQVIAHLEEQKALLHDDKDMSTKQGLEKKLAEAKQMLADVGDGNADLSSQINTLIQSYEEKLVDVEKTDYSKVVRGLDSKISEIDDQLKRARQSFDVMHTESQPKPSEINVGDEVKNISHDDETVAHSSAEKLINLSMASPERLSVNVAQQLANDTSNNLSDAHRAYFRAFSQARIAEHTLKKYDDVSEDIFKGNKAGTYKGINAYRKELMAALAGNDRKTADRLIAGLTKFYESHSNKAKTADEALKLAQEQGKSVAIRNDGKRGWFINQDPNFTQEQRRKEGAFFVSTTGEKHVNRFTDEASAIGATLDELKAAYDSKFSPEKKETQDVKDVSPATGAKTSEEQPKEESKAEASSSERDSKAGEGTAKPAVQSSEAVGVTEEAPASVVTPKEDAQLQSTETKTSTPQEDSTKAVPEEAPTADAVSEEQLAKLKEETKAEQEDTEVQPGKLAASEQHAAEGATFWEKKFGDLFSQSAGGKQDGSKRPLVAVKDFMKMVAAGAVQLTDFIKQKVDGLENVDAMDRRDAAWKLFVEKAAEWAPQIVANIKPVKAGNEKFNYLDPIRYIQTIDGQTVVEENLKTAIVAAVFAYVYDEAGRSGINDDKAINKILGRSEDSLVSDTAKRTLNEGTYRNLLVDTLGQKIIESLGISPRPDTTKEQIARLRVSLGAHALKLMEDKDILVRKSIPGGTMEFLRRENTDKEIGLDEAMAMELPDHTLYVLKNAEGVMTPVAQQIATTFSGSESFINKLFGMESAARLPSLVPITEIQEKSKTGMGLPTQIQRTFKQKQTQEAFVVSPDPMKVLSFFTEDQGLKMAGVTEVNERNTHTTNQSSRKAKNDATTRDFQTFMGFVGEMLAPSKEGLKQPFYYPLEMWKQQRVGIDTTVANPQASKVVRPLVSGQNWNVAIKLDGPLLEPVLMMVAEGFGAKLEVGAPEIHINELHEKMQGDKFAPGLKALQRMLFEDSPEISDAEKQHVINAVLEGGEDLASLKALITYARYQHAMNTEGVTEFETDIMGAADGVSSGAMLNHMLYGIGDGQLLNRGGFFFKGDKDRQFNLWKGKGNKDIYQHIAQQINGYVAWLGKKDMVDPKIIAAIWFLAGSPVKDGKVTKDGRNLVKDAINPLNFGAGLPSIKAGMFGVFVEKIYERFEKLSEGEATPEQIAAVVGSLNTLLEAGGQKAWPTNREISYYMNRAFTTAEVNALMKSHFDTVGRATAGVLKREFEQFISRKNELVSTTNAAYELFNAVYSATRQDRMDELGIPHDKNGNPRYDLSTRQEQELGNEMLPITPVMHTAMSWEGRDLSSGILLAQRETVTMSDNPLYEVEVQFGTNIKGSTASQMSATGRATRQTNPGVVAISAATHAGDSQISHRTQMRHDKDHQRTTVNMHDSVGTGIADLSSMVNDLNKNTFEMLLGYSPMAAGYEALARVARGILAMDAKGQLTKEAKANLRKYFETKAEEESEYAQTQISPQEMVYQALMGAFAAAQSSDIGRLQRLAALEIVDQYPFAANGYTVTEDDHKRVQEALDKVNAQSREETTDLIAAFNEMLFEQAEQPEATIESVFGELGESKIPHDNRLVKFFQRNPTPTVAQLVQVLNNSATLSPLQRRYLEVVSKLVGSDLKINYITAQTPLSAVMEVSKDANARGWYVANGDASAHEINILSPEFKNSGVDAEVLLHELTHSAVATIVARELARKEADPSYTSETLELVEELEALRVKAEEFVAANKLEGKFGSAVADVQELISWGMTNLEFQQQVLAKVSMATGNAGNALVAGAKKNGLLDGLKAFINTLAKLIFKNGRAEEATGLGVLITNVSGLFHEASQTRGSVTPGTQAETPVTGAKLNLAQANNAQASPIDSFTTEEIYDALDNGSLEPEFKAQVREHLTNLVEALHGPFGAFAQAMRKTEAGNPLATWLKAMETGHAPFASAIVASNFSGSAQEDFAMQQIEATVKAALEDSEATTKTIYRELYKLYTEMESVLKPSDFASQEDYDFVFKLDPDQGDRSDYLARFAAMGLANQRFNKLLKRATEKDNRSLGDGDTWMERLTVVFDKILAFFSEKIAHVYGGQQADEKLSVLVSQLVDMEARKRAALKAREFEVTPSEEVDKKVAATVDMLRTKFGDIAAADIIKNSANSFVRLGGSLVRISTKGILDKYFDQMKSFRDTYTKEKHGTIMGLLSELTGPLQKFEELLRARKRQEQQRKNMISATAKLAMDVFQNGGKDMTKEQRDAITQVFLRTGLHNLLGDFDLKDIDSFLSDKAAVEQALATLEAKLPAHLRDMYVEQVNGLGAYNATGLVKVDVLMLNAHLISRMAGTQYQKRISSKEAAQYEQTLAQMAALYGLTYLTPSQLAAAREVLRSENSRTDNGNGIEFVLALHKQFEQDSREKLFKDSPALMAMGYTPEVLNPHIAIVIANDEEGKNLVEQGYSRGALVSPDPADPTAEKKRIYVLKDGGLMPWQSQVMSMTDTHTKGTLKHSGYVNVNTQEGLENAQLQASVTTEKLKGLAMKKDPRRNLMASKDNNMAPVFNANGEIVNWRYLMAHDSKDALLERDNRFDQVLGALSGSIFDKSTSHEVNHQMVMALRDQFDAEYHRESQSYIFVGSKAVDPKMKELWDMLPEATKNDIRAVWGRDGMMVRKDALDITFGYRKYSLSEAFMKTPSMRNDFERFTLESLEALLVAMGRTPEQAANHIKKIGTAVARGERIWAEIVREIKDIVVVKNLTTLIGNIKSNMSQLFLHGVPWKDILHHHIVAIRGALAYHRDAERLHELETRLATGYTQGQETEIKREIVRLKDLIARNPVKELMDAGLMPTIVEDVSQEEDIYSYKSQFGRKIEQYTDKLHPGVRNLGRFVYMTHDTPLYQMLSQATQLSDFVARYTLYQHMTNRKENPLSKHDAINKVSEEFINYDVALPKGIQYLDDMGIAPFTKYFLRIQRVLVKMFRENPARVLSTGLLDQFYDLGPIVLDSHWAHHVGNMPVHSGPFRIFETLDELATVKGAFALVK